MGGVALRELSTKLMNGAALPKSCPCRGRQPDASNNIKRGIALTYENIRRSVVLSHDGYYFTRIQDEQPNRKALVGLRFPRRTIIIPLGHDKASAVTRGPEKKW